MVRFADPRIPLGCSCEGSGSSLGCPVARWHSAENWQGQERIAVLALARVAYLQAGDDGLAMVQEQVAQTILYCKRQMEAKLCGP